MYQFPIVAVTNSNKFSGLGHKFILTQLGGHKSKLGFPESKPRCRHSCPTCGGSWGERPLSFARFQSCTASMPWLMATSFTSEASAVVSSNLCFHCRVPLITRVLLQRALGSYWAHLGNPG